MDHRVKFLLVILVLLASCKTHKKITKSSVQESRQSSVVDFQQHNHQQNERSRDREIIRSDNDRSSIISFEGTGTIVIEPSGIIRADGINPRVEYIDRSRSSTIRQSEKELNSHSSSQSGREVTEKEKKEAETIDKEITRTNYTPVILTVAGCLIFLVVGWVIYRKFKW